MHTRQQREAMGAQWAGAVRGEAPPPPAVALLSDDAGRLSKLAHPGTVTGVAIVPDALRGQAIIRWGGDGVVGERGAGALE